MREIKFRAWDKEHKIMFSGIPFPNDCAGDLNCGESSYYVDEETQKELKTWDWEFCDWMQYTGLKDKNGKEIYDGDILENDTEWWEVVWDNEQARWECSPIKDGNVYLALSEIADSIDTSIQGNIYETPELLTN